MNAKRAAEEWPPCCFFSETGLRKKCDIRIIIGAGCGRHRPELKRMIDQIRKGDMTVDWKLARSTTFAGDHGVDPGERKQFQSLAERGRSQASK